MKRLSLIAHKIFPKFTEEQLFILTITVLFLLIFTDLKHTILGTAMSDSEAFVTIFCGAILFGWGYFLCIKYAFVEKTASTRELGVMVFTAGFTIAVMGLYCGTYALKHIHSSFLVSKIMLVFALWNIAQSFIIFVTLRESDELKMDLSRYVVGGNANIRLLLIGSAVSIGVCIWGTYFAYYPPLITGAIAYGTASIFLWKERIEMKDVRKGL